MTSTTSTTSSTTSATTTTSTSSSSTSSTSTSSSSSDIDWDALIEAAVLEKQLPADRVEAKIEENETEIEAYTEMQDLLSDVLDAIEAIRGTDDSLTELDDIFSERAAYLTGVGDVEAEDALVVTCEAGVDIATYDITIDQLAKSQKVISAEGVVEDSTEALGFEGTMSFKMSGSEDDAVEIEVTDDMSLVEIASEINNYTEDSGVTATVVQVSDSDYRLVLTSETGNDIDYTAGDGDDILNSLGMTTDDGDWANILQESQDAIITVDGVQITRDTNTVDDVIEGVTFALYQVTEEDASISVEISQSLSDIKEAVVTLVDAYNAYREWALQQQEIDASGTVSDDAVLYGDSLLRGTNTAIYDAISTVVDGESMALLGLSYDENNYLELDEDTLNDALLNDIDQIEDMLNFQYEVSDSDLALLKRTSDMPSSFTLDIEVDEDGEVTSILCDGESGCFEVSGSRIVGVEGTEYEGITFVYTGDESDTIDFSCTAGIIENLYQAVSKYADEDEGLIISKIETLEEQNEDYEAEYEDIMETVDAYEERLTELYASYQAAIEEAQSSLDYIEAILDSGD
ncbi:flagellar filament capping protein FliD [uncultured Cohaesibacter sp.]|uniref:flagellar filament capping protein FliD n=1 Tax=uncultured Cohaesibacter sp. TaxID=1002546 RepID=UPI00292DD878|nr:flagellar filament capping protein FliD [uncultured Cohaesibacter sp.]